MTEMTIYHNPRCSKCRQALDLLHDKGIKPQIVEYVKTPPSASELKNILKKLNIPAHDLLRTKELEYKELGLDKPGMSEEAIIAAMISHPTLIQRPIIIVGDKAVIGRSEEAVCDIAGV